MPELPEVETICRGFAKKTRLVDCTFLKVTVGEKPLLWQSSTETDLKDWVEGRRLDRLERHGKHLLFYLEGGVILRIHLGMTGRLCLKTPPLDYDPYIRLTFRIDDKDKPFWVFHDVRRFGQVRVFPPGDDPLENIGPEPFSQEVTSKWLSNQAQGSPAN
jgi:formamidopyrimidine-DNA glycosylase